MSNSAPCDLDGVLVDVFLQSNVNRRITTFAICDIRNNQGFGKCYRPRPTISAEKIYLDLDHSQYHKYLIQKLHSVKCVGILRVYK